MSHSLVRALRARGVEVTTAGDEEMIACKDEDQLDYATRQGRVLFTFNVADFYRLHTVYVAQERPHAGMILAHQQRFSIGEQLRRLLRLLASRSAEDMRNRVEFLSAWG